MYEHKSVLLNESIEGLAIKKSGIYVDATTGGGGHSYQILKRLDYAGHLYCFDQDEAAIEASKEHLQTLSLNNFTLIHSNFRFLKEKLEECNVKKVDGIIFDLGVSSFQLDEGSRGFSYNHDALLDMRMDQTQSLTAKEVINSYKEEDIANIIYKYGEEKYSRNIARNIVKERTKKEILTTHELVEIIKKSIPTKSKITGGHPAKRTFQALRIYVNDELGILSKTLEVAIKLLNSGGRVCVITFHSLEDRIVKEVFKKYTTEESRNRFMPIDLKKKDIQYNLITRKPIIPSTQEIENNNRAHSAKLRIIQKI
ncbi:MAG: 16S rRNA (cytosine(1402)-N(4))-methyltransferase RsmH [Bacilli bacterium]|nr:16S rRNA (cytosine(1402)-N(4))-methyltransferase RsmH [Bacilli bacterium]